MNWELILSTLKEGLFTVVVFAGPLVLADIRGRRADRKRREQDD